MERFMILAGFLKEKQYKFGQIEYKSIEFSLFYQKKNQQQVTRDQYDETRKPLIEGGYIMQQKVNRMFKKQLSKVHPKIIRINPQKLIPQWTEQEQRQLCLLYLEYHSSNDFIVENLKAKPGHSDKWKDFEIVGRKIDHIIKRGLVRLQELTAKPYNRIQKMMEQQRRLKMKEQLVKKQKVEYVKKQAQPLTNANQNKKASQKTHHFY